MESKEDLKKDPLFQLSKEQDEVIETILNAPGNFMVTGPSGSGKTSVLKELARQASQMGQKILVCAPTGLGAEVAGGKTLHSALHIPLRLIQDGHLISIDPSLLRDVDMLLIDGAQALSPIFMDVLWEAYDKAKKGKRAFRIALFGDFYGLCPIMDQKERDAYIRLTNTTVNPRFTFQAVHWGDFEFTSLKLKEILRDGDQEYKDSLSRLRIGDRGGMQPVQNLTSASPIENVPWLYPSRKEADIKNAECVNALPGKEWRLFGTVTGQPTNEWFPVPQCLVLKEGMNVVMAANHPNGCYVNGSRGKIRRIVSGKDGAIVIYVVIPGKNGHIRVDPYTWTAPTSSESSVAYTQYPILAGYAFSAYQVSSMHLDGANISGTCRTHGQLYTLLSRCLFPSRVHLDLYKPVNQLNVSSAVKQWERSEGHDIDLDDLANSVLCVPFTSIESGGYREGVRFGLSFLPVDYKEKRLTRTIICLKDAYGNVCGVTNYSVYIRPKTSSLESTIGNTAYFIVAFLNYVFIDAFQIRNLEEVTIEHLRSFVHAYGTGAYGNRTRTKQTICQCVYMLLRFMDALLNDRSLDMSLKKDDLYTEKLSVGNEGARIYYKNSLAFRLTHDPDSHFILRDIPEAALRILVSIAATRHIQILLNIALSLCGGLRPSETCSLGMLDLSLSWDGDRLMSVQINLTREKPLRADRGPCAKIKKHRMATIHEKFLPLFESLYKIYLPWWTSHCKDSVYRPLCLNNSGYAMDYHFYYRCFKELAAEIVPILQTDPDASIRDYAKILKREGIAPHILRHAFSEMLVRMGFNSYQIMGYRGDTSLESANVYLARKSDIAKIKDEWVDMIAKTLADIKPIR